MARPTREESIYRISIHKNGGYMYASTHPYTVTPEGKRKYCKHSVMPVFDFMISWSTKVDFPKPPKHSESMWSFQEFLLE